MRRDRAVLEVALGVACLAWGCAGVVLHSLYEEPLERLDCCTNNLFAKVLGNLQACCQAAGPGDVVQLPFMLEEDGRLLSGKHRLGLDVLTSEDIVHLKEIGKRYGCTIVTREEAAAHGTQRAVCKRTTMSVNGPFVCWFYSRLKIPRKLLHDMKKCASEAAVAFGAGHLLDRPDLSENPLALLRSLKYVAVHARLELDWAGYCKRRPTQPQNRKESRKMCFDATEMATAIVKNEHFPAQGRNYVLIHSNHLHAKQQLGTGGHPAEVWPAVIPGARVFDKMNATCLSKHVTQNFQALMDMFFGMYSQEWVGHHASTFTNAVTKMRSCDQSKEALSKWKPEMANDAAGKSDYVYSCQKEGSLVRRQDKGDVDTTRFGVADGDFCRYTAFLKQPKYLRHTRSGKGLPRKPDEHL